MSFLQIGCPLSSLVNRSIHKKSTRSQQPLQAPTNGEPRAWPAERTGLHASVRIWPDIPCAINIQPAFNGTCGELATFTQT